MGLSARAARSVRKAVTLSLRGAAKKKAPPLHLRIGERPTPANEMHPSWSPEFREAWLVLQLDPTAEGDYRIRKNRSGRAGGTLSYADAKRLAEATTGRVLWLDDQARRLTVPSAKERQRRSEVRNARQVPKREAMAAADLAFARLSAKDGDSWFPAKNPEGTVVRVPEGVVSRLTMEEAKAEAQRIADELGRTLSVWWFSEGKPYQNVHYASGTEIKNGTVADGRTDRPRPARFPRPEAINAALGTEAARKADLVFMRVGNDNLHRTKPEDWLLVKNTHGPGSVGRWFSTADQVTLLAGLEELDGGRAVASWFNGDGTGCFMPVSVYTGMEERGLWPRHKRDAKVTEAAALGGVAAEQAKGVDAPPENPAVMPFMAVVRPCVLCGEGCKLPEEDANVRVLVQQVVSGYVLDEDEDLTVLTEAGQNVHYHAVCGLTAITYRKSEED